MTSPARKDRDRSKLATHRERNKGRPCGVEDCLKVVQTGARYCGRHQIRHLKLHNPLGEIPTLVEVEPWVEHVERLLLVNKKHPAPAAGIRILHEWMAHVVDVTEHPYSQSLMRRRSHAKLLAIKAIQRGLTPESMLVFLAATACYLRKHGLASTMPGEFAATVAWTLSRRIGLPEDSTGKQRTGWKLTPLREFTRHILDGSLLRLLFNLATGVDSMLEADRRRLQAVGIPVNTPITYEPSGSIKPFTFESFEEVLPT